MVPVSRRARRRTSGLTKALLLLAFVVVVVWASAAWASVRSARAEAARAEDRLSRLMGGIDVQAVLEGADVGGLRSVAGDLRLTQERLRSPLLRPVRPLPVLGRQLRSADALLGTTARLADATADAEVEAGAAVAALKVPGASRLDALRRLSGTVRNLEQVVATSDLGPRDGLVEQLDTARGRAADTLAEVGGRLRTAAETLEIGTEVLAGPSRYLLVVANNAEMRGGSGTYLSIGVLSASEGQLKLDGPDSVGRFKVPPGIVAPEADVAARWGWLRPTDYFQSLMLSPRFEASAPPAARMWELAGQAPVDGVIAVDVGAVVSLLRSVGPIEVDGVTLTAATAQEELLHGQYLRFPDKADRRDSLQVIAGEIFGRLTAGAVDLPTVADGLVQAVRGRHLMAWSRRAPDQALWDRSGAHGRLTDASLLVSSINVGSNKLDPNLKVAARLSNAPSPRADATDHELRITLTNSSRSSDPTYVTGPNLDYLKNGEYFGILSVNLPGYANQPSIDGQTALAVYGTDGPGRVIGVQYRLLRGESRTVVVRFQTAGGEGSLRLEPSSRLPGIRWETDEAAVPDDRATVVRWPAPLAEAVVPPPEGDESTPVSGAGPDEPTMGGG